MKPGHQSGYPIVAMRPVVLECAVCGGSFDRDGQPFEPSGGYILHGFVCPACERSVDRVGRRLRNSGLPAGFHDLSFDALDRSDGRERAIAAAEEWSERVIAPLAVGRETERNGLLLFGPVGSGKTRIAATAARARLVRERLTWVSVPALIQQALAAFDSDERRGAVEALTGSGALVLDDLDKAKPSEWVLSQLFVAIDSRVTAEVPLLVTTNLGPAEIRDRLGEPIASRLAGYCTVRKLDGRDRRFDPKGSA